MKIRTFLVLALLLGSSHASSQSDLELKKAFDDSLLGSFHQLVDSYRELDAAGLLENNTIVVLPPLFLANPVDSRPLNQVTHVSRAGEHVADYFGRRLRDALPQARVIFGADVENRFRGAVLSLGKYESMAAGLRLADPLRAGLIIAGTLQQYDGSRSPSFVVELRAQRPGKDIVSDWTPGEITITKRGRAGYRKLDEENQVESRVPFGADPRVKDREPSVDTLDDLIEESLLLALQETAMDFSAFLEAEASAGRILAPGEGNLVVLPVEAENGRTTLLADEIAFTLVDQLEASGPEDLVARLEQAGRRKNGIDLTLGEVMTYGLDASAFEGLDISHLIRASYRTSRLRTSGSRAGGTLTLTISATDKVGGFVSRAFRISVGSGAKMVKQWIDEGSEFSFEPAPLDPEKVLRDELRDLMPRALAQSGIDFSSHSLRLLPLETPETGSVLEAFGVVRSQLAREHVDVERRADEADVPASEAIRSKDFPVVIDVLNQEFATWEEARRTLMNLCWANLALSDAFALGKRLQTDYRVEVFKVAPQLQAIPANLTAVDLELNQVRSSTTDAAEDVDIFLQQDPDYLLTARWVDQGTRSSLVAQVVDFSNPGQIRYLERVELSHAETDAVRQIIGSAPTFSGPKALKDLLGLGASEGSSRAKGQGVDLPERDLLAGVDLHMRWEGDLGKKVAQQLTFDLESFPFDLPRPASSRESNQWATLDPKMATRMEIRWFGPEDDPRAKAAAEALLSLLRERENAWLSSEARFTAQRLNVGINAVSGEKAFLDLDQQTERPTLLVLIRGK